MELNEEKLKEAVIKYLRKGCKKCPDFRTGKPRLLVNPDCACVSFLKDVENKTKEIKNILNYYSRYIMKDNITFISADDDQRVRCIICGAIKTIPIRQFPLIVCDKCRAAIMKIRETTDKED